MSGHSKWATIRHDKGLNDAKRGKVFSKLAQQISLAAREGGGDSNSNPTLRLLLSKAKEVSMPTANIERAIARGTGQGDEGSIIFEPATYEGFGPAGVGVVVDALTDNKNRTVSDLRSLFADNGGNLAESGAVSWNFDHKGLVLVRSGKLVASDKFGQPEQFVEADKDQVMIQLMDIKGVQDIQEVEMDAGIGFEVYSEVQDMGIVRDAIMNLGYVVKAAQLVKVPKTLKELSEEDKERVRNFVDLIDDYSDVQHVWIDAVL